MTKLASSRNIRLPPETVFRALHDRSRWLDPSLSIEREGSLVTVKYGAMTLEGRVDELAPARITARVNTASDDWMALVNITVDGVDALETRITVELGLQPEEGEMKAESCEVVREVLEYQLDRLATYLDGDDPSAIPLSPPRGQLENVSERIKLLGESTFESLGLLMPLYGGSVWMSDYVGVAKCAVHGAVEPHCFHVNAIRVTCGKCGQKTFRKREFVKCVHCRATVPPLRSSQDPLACHAAIVAGDAAFQVSTHLGLVSAFKRPRKIAPEAYELLLRTSPLSSWQEVAWPFHCSAPMTYLGSRTSEQLAELPLNESERKTLDDDIYEADDQVIEDLMTFHCATCLHYQWVHDRD